MAELQKMIQNTGNASGAFNSDLMKTFVAKNRGDNKEPELSPMLSQKTTGGASIFSTTTTTTTSSTGTDTTDNAIIFQQKSLPDNHHNNITNTNTTTTTVDNKTLQSQTQMENANLNDARNANLNANLNVANKTKPAASPDVLNRNANASEVTAVLQEVRGAMSESRQQLVQEVTEAAVDAHFATCINTQKTVAEARARFMAMKASGQLPDMSKLSLSAGAMWEKMMDQMKPELGKTMKFFKILPGFGELRADDQMRLIKAGMFEVMMTRFSMLIDHEQDTMLDPSHKMVCPRQVIKAMPMGDFLDGFFHVGQQFNPIGMTDGEVALFTAVLVFSPCRPGLCDTQLVSRLQALYQQALFCLLKKNHSDPESKLTKALSLVPMFQRMSEEHSKALGAMKMQSPDAFSQHFPPVHKEFYSPESQ